ncbi:hypothetical protein SCHPADRAFT_410767 [Schizopora paradoxa]|uniref:Uncharacterized protein n=1 Tax=Schizopora paradoxa TaxID=27342 RepID=A0A0H2S6S5_9AGAM|nr:hypothetical protein SCHPADRAFT_410767 [Schizopora paradoxa]
MRKKNNPNANDIIRADLTKALRNCEDSAGSFYSLRTYSVAPNPCILVDGRGVLGLPLSKSEGERLIPRVSQQNPTTSQMTTQTSCSLAVEVPEIHIRNNGFEKFLKEKVIPAVCSDLGVHTWITEPLAELHTMFLCTSGSQLVPCHDPKPVPTRTFGKLLVFLPSDFAGGSLQLSRDGSKYLETTKLEANSAISTSVLAWFNGVSVKSLPVLTGYRLVLSYHLIQTSPTAILPGLDVQAEGVEGVRQVLLRWMQKKKGNDANTIAEVLYYIWDEDPRLTAQLAPLASELGITLYRAEVEMYRFGSVTEPGDYQARRTDVRRRGDYGNGDEGQNDDVEFDEVHAEEFRIQKLTSLNGEIVKGFKEIPFEESMFIPMDFKDELDKPDKREYGGIWQTAKTLVLSRCIGNLAFPRPRRYQDHHSFHFRKSSEDRNFF